MKSLSYKNKKLNKQNIVELIFSVCFITIPETMIESIIRLENIFCSDKNSDTVEINLERWKHLMFTSVNDYNNSYGTNFDTLQELENELNAIGYRVIFSDCIADVLYFIWE